jgi:membrane protease subunit (stomatin/prohibitin family)
MPLIRRGGRPGLLGTVARTAVIAGTANAVTARHQERAQQRAQQQAAAAAPAAPAADDLAAQIQRLGDLHAVGTLTDDEFAAAKARLLG